MDSINFLGSYSGIDQSVIDQLMEVERLPLNQLENKISDLTEEQNAWKDVNTRLNSLFEKIKVLKDSKTFTSKSSISTNSDAVSITAEENAIEGNYKIYIEQLATNTSIISGDVSLSGGDLNAELGIEGQLTIKNHEGESVEINIGSQDSLKAIVSKVNESTEDTGISASIIDNHLILSDTQTGERNITIEGDENDTLGKLGLSDTRTEQQGVNAKFTINGVDVERSSNAISDVIEFTTIELKKEHSAGQFDTVNVTLDSSKMTKAVQDFVDQYNSTMSFIEEKLEAGDPVEGTSGGTLASDGTLMRLHSSLRRLVTSGSSNKSTDIYDISELGVSTVDKYGKLQFDSSELTEAIEEDLENVMNFFISKDSDGKEIGFVNRVNEYIDTFIASDEGIIQGKTKSLSSTIKDLNDQIDVFNDRMVKKEQRYINMFTQLDVAMMEAESQMSWLMGQLNTLNASTGSI